MGIVQQLFVDIFITLYPMIHNHFVSYILFLAIIALGAYFVFKLTKRYKKSSFLKFVLIGAQCFLLVYMAWYVLFFFHTYENVANIEQQHYKTAQNQK